MTGWGQGRWGHFLFYVPFVLLKKPRLSGYVGEPVVKEMLRNFSVRGR